MKKVYVKISGMIAMLMTILTFGLWTPIFLGQVDRGLGLALLALGSLPAICSLFFYFVDAVLSVIKVFKKIHPVFNGIVAVAIVGIIPMTWLLLRVTLPLLRDVVGNALWLPFLYGLALVVLEIVSIIKHIKLSRIDKISKLEQRIEPQ